MALRWIMALFPVLLIACATGPEFDNTVYLQRTTPEEAANNIDAYRDIEVMWGGLLVSSTSLERSTQLELLAYPLNRKQKPDTTQSALGRFVLVVDGFLEPVDYAEGRIVTATGRLTDVKDSAVGSAQYRFPIVEADDLYLWPKSSGSSKPRIHFGVGFSF